MPEPQFPHLHLLYKDQGGAVLEGGGRANPAAQYNTRNRQQHSALLNQRIAGFTRHAIALQQERLNANLPPVRGGVPFLLTIPDGDDGAIEFIAEKLGLEIVAEYEDGFLIVATSDLDLAKVTELANEFAQSKHGSGGMAKILALDENPLSENRINLLLDDRLKPQWPFADAAEFILDVSIESASFGRPVKQRSNHRTAPAVRAQREAAYEEAKRQFVQRWDEERIARENELGAFVQHYGGEICNITDDSHLVEFPDSFSMRIKMSGAGFKDLIKNYPSLFEVMLPDDIEQTNNGNPGVAEDESNIEVLVPAAESPKICIVDSGIQEGHRWLNAAIDQARSRCFIPDKNLDDVADYVQGGGHGTRVAGAALYPHAIPREGQLQSPFWLINARVLNEHNTLIDKIFPPQLLREIVAHYKDGKVRIYNHSIASNRCCRLTRMSAWAAAIDLLSYEEDVLFIQAVGNLTSTGVANNPGILDHILQHRHYPAYLYEPSSRVANPAQSLQALTVGSISADFFQGPDSRSMAAARRPSSFTRTGFGLWNSIKPEVVEFGGDDVIDNGNPPSLTNPPEVCPELLRSTMFGGTPHARDAVGTSYSTPKVTHIAGHLAALFPDRETLLYRALIVNSARWPDWAEHVPMADRPRMVQAVGYGVPSLERATENGANRITLITESSYEIKAKEGFVFGIPIPEVLRRPGEDYSVRIDVTLSYAAEPRRTRKSRRGYLGVWLDWKASKRNETFEAFRGRALVENEEVEGIGDTNFPWQLGNKRERDGITDGVTRRNGTVQKDWTFAHSYELPDTFGIVVRGHEGWDRANPEATAKFALVVSFEAIGAEVPIYEEVKLAVELEAEAEVEIAD